MRQFLCLFTHCGLSPAGLRALAEVSRNRTDRPDRIGTTGFEVLGEHQPACTSELILRGPCSGVNLMRVIEPLPKISAPPRCQPDPDVASASSQAASGWLQALVDLMDHFFKVCSRFRVEPNIKSSSSHLCRVPGDEGQR